MKISARNKML